MTLVSSLSSSAADVNDKYNNKRLPKGIHIVEADDASDSKVRGMSKMKRKGHLGDIFYSTYVGWQFREET